MVDLVDHAVLVGGLDYWRWRKGGQRKISEPRLRFCDRRLFGSVELRDGDSFRAGECERRPT